MLSSALSEFNVKVKLCIWDDNSIEWSNYDAAIIRSTWDYTQNFEKYIEFIDNASNQTKLINNQEVLLWNLDKHYMKELSTKISTIPTTYIEKDNKSKLPEYPEYVIKPTISNSGKNSGRFQRKKDDIKASLLLENILRTSTAMIQPYIPSIDSQGEKSLVFIGGDFSHSIIKGAVLLPEGERSPIASTDANITPAKANDSEIDFAYEVLSATPFDKSDLTYARVDIAKSDNEELMLMELELIEPNLFMSLYPDATGKLAEAIISQIQN